MHGTTVKIKNVYILQPSLKYILVLVHQMLC